MGKISEIGEDLLEVLEELGSKISIYKYSTGQTFEEFVDTSFEVNHVYPWTSHYMMKCDFGYNTKADAGDLITFIDDMQHPTKYLIVALAKERFEQSVIAKEGVIYMCDSIAHIQRRTEIRNASTNYEPIVSWPTVYSGEYCFITGLLDNNKEFERKFGEFSVDRNQLFISTFIDIREGDRCTVNSDNYSGEVYQVISVEKDYLPGISICNINEDNRE